MDKYCFENILIKNKDRVESLKAKTNKIVVFGAGNTACLYLKCFEEEGIDVQVFVDNNKNKSFTGGQVVSPDSLESECGQDVLVLICTSVDNTYHEIQQQMEGMGFLCCGVDEYVFAQRMPELLECYDSFEDEESRDLYAELIMWRMQHVDPCLPILHQEQYFAQRDFLTSSNNEVFVDVGAFVGDTIERYLHKKEGVFSKIYAFEPDKDNYQALVYRLERLQREWGIKDGRIFPVNCGIGSKKSFRKVYRPSGTGLGSMVVDSAGDKEHLQNVDIVTIDDYFLEQKVDFIKADIESYEYDMLLGSSKLIKRDRPKIAICIYHNATDMYRVMLYLKNLNLNYKFQLSHHSVTKSETVLYAY